MTKKQRNRKSVAQNKRNRMINRRYSSTIKTLSKLFFSKVKTFEIETMADQQLKLKEETTKILNSLYSIIDKAVKKNVLHQNNAARKKSRVGRSFSQMSQSV